MHDVGLSVRVDALGNIFGRREGVESSLPPILVGSHIDTVPDGGAYDGALGVLGAIEVIQSLTDSKCDTRYPIEVVAWSDEEGGLSGSRGFVGQLNEAELGILVPGGFSLGEGIERVGGEVARIADAAKSEADVAAYLELHVEQGGILEVNGIDIGVVTGIVGIRHHSVTFTGKTNHAGTTPMDQRRNALLAASEFVLAVDRIVRSVEGNQVGTVGELTVRPGAPNVIPGEVRLTVELRDLEMDKLRSIWEMLQLELDAYASKYGVEAESTIVHTVAGVGTDRGVQKLIAASAAQLGLSHCLMPSGAGHDAQNLARITPTGMIFVPSVGGISHSPEEYTKAEAAANGVEVLLSTLMRLDRLNS
jgi:N-carbamoyl-L-amino-acid hydrolase